MERLRRASLENWIIIEHRNGGDNVVGKIGGFIPMGADGSFHIYFFRWVISLFDSTTAREMAFLPSCWQCEFVGAGEPFVIFFKRIADDPPDLESTSPCPDANLYTLVRPDIKRLFFWL